MFIALAAVMLWCGVEKCAKKNVLNKIGNGMAMVC
jgi:hypothetical protein